MNLALMALQIIGLYIIMVVGIQYFDVYLLFCEICKGSEGNPGILQGLTQMKKPMTEKKGEMEELQGGEQKHDSIIGVEAEK